MKKLILAIETSCDETGLALVEASGGLRAPKFKILKNLVASQIKIHRPFGGVVPNLAKREHLKNLPVLYRKIFGEGPSSVKTSAGKQIANRFWKKIDLIAVTVGPGLEPALWTGIEFAKALRRVRGKPLVGANHLEGHLYSFFLPSQKKTVRSKIKSQKSKVFPAVALIVSGGHTILLLMQSLTKWKKLGETRDDAAGEAFDKVARLLDLSYPGGPEIEKIAKKGDPAAINFPRPMIHQKNYDFSFSGLKTAVFYYLRDLGYSQSDIATSKTAKNSLNPIGQTQLANIAASFQQAAVDILVYKTLRAAKEFSAKGGSPPDGRAGASGGKAIIKSIMLSGGVAANKLLRKTLKKESKKLGCNFFAPKAEYNTDNAAMIAIAGYMTYLLGKKYNLTAQGNLNI